MEYQRSEILRILVSIPLVHVQRSHAVSVDEKVRKGSRLPIPWLEI